MAEEDSAYNGVMNRRNTRANAMMGRCGYKKGGAVKQDDEAEDKKLIKREMGKAKIKLKSGGHADGHKSKPRLDKYARGGATKGKKGSTTVNVVIAGGGGQQQPQKIPVPVPAGGGPGGPPRPPMPPQGGGMAPPGSGMPPGAMPPRPGMKRGGIVKMKAGAGGGLGRLEKIKDYGAKPYRKSGGKC